MDLPRELWPWRQSLAIFPPELAIALGGLVDRLALLMGPLVSPDSSGRDQPDGIGGVGRRGSFERLLATDWALADEAPLEFLRRVCAGELSFLEIAHQKPTVARHCVVLFDVGPDQRGGPRIVQLALLILMAQRAQAGGASFAWGILQNDSREFITDVNEESVRRLVQGGSLRRVAIEDMIGFYQTLPHEETAEVWFVGGSFGYEVNATVTPYRIVIEDSLNPDAPSNVEVTVVGPNDKPKSISLELPKGNAAVRLIRDPFRVARTVPQKTAVLPAPDTNLVLSRDDRLLFFQGLNGELCTMPLPNSPNFKDLPKLRIFRPPHGERIIAVGRLTESRSVGVATVHGEEVVVHRLSHRMSASLLARRHTWELSSSPPPVTHFPVWFNNPEARGPLGQLFQLSGIDTFFLHDSARMLFKIEKDVIRIWDFPTPTACQTHNGVFWQRHWEQAMWMCNNGATQTSRPLPPALQSVHPMLGGQLLIQLTPRTVRIVDSEGVLAYEGEIPPDVKLLGGVYAKNYQLYVLDSSRTQLLCLEDGKAEICCKSSAPIKTITASLNCWLIAFLTEEDELCVYAGEYKTLILRMRLGAS